MFPVDRPIGKIGLVFVFCYFEAHIGRFRCIPDIVRLRTKCDWSNAENGDFCDGGFIKDKQGHYKMDNAGVLMRCPKCGNKRTVGPGSFVEIPVPNPNGDGMDYVPDMKTRYKC